MQLFPIRQQTELVEACCVLGDLALGSQCPTEASRGPCWLRLSSSALHTHMDTTVEFPSLNCTMNG